MFLFSQPEVMLCRDTTAVLFLPPGVLKLHGLYKAPGGCLRGQSGADSSDDLVHYAISLVFVVAFLQSTNPNRVPATSVPLEGYGTGGGPL